MYLCKKTKSFLQNKSSGRRTEFCRSKSSALPVDTKVSLAVGVVGVAVDGWAEKQSIVLWYAYKNGHSLTGWAP